MNEALAGANVGAGVAVVRWNNIERHTLRCACRSLRATPEVSFRIECFWHLDHLGQNRFDATHFLVSKNAQVQMFFELCVFPFVIEEMFQLLEPS